MSELRATSKVFIPEPVQVSRREKGESSLAPGKGASVQGSFTFDERDTVALSEGGQKIVNLARGNELAAEIRTAPADGTFAQRLRSAVNDVTRIGRLFGETLKSAFHAWR